MNKLIIALGLLIFLVGCAHEHANRNTNVRYVPVKVNNVRPAYPMPSPGYVWRRHPRFGWGWFHPRVGWHQGWR
jgi:hypothetical protein